MLCALAFLQGTWAIHIISARFCLFAWAIGLGLGCLAYCWRGTWFGFTSKLLVFLVLGFAWASLRLAYVQAAQLAPNLEKKSLLVIGQIQGVPEIYQDHVSLHFKVKQMVRPYLPLSHQVLWKLNWYGTKLALKPGQSWQLEVRVKRPHGLANPGSYNREISALQQRLNAIGYVKNSAYNSLLGKSRWSNPIDTLRYHLMLKLSAQVHDKQLLGYLAALTIGVKYPITYKQWQLLRATGTSHLMAISGLHVGLIAGLLFALANMLWSRCESLALKLPATQAAAALSLLAGFCYSLLAGLSISTQRALLMLSIYLLLVLCKRQTQMSQALALALLGVLLWDPLAHLSAGFWLSFAAVGMILYGSVARFHPRGLWWRYGRVQWVVSLGLLPISLALFQQASLSAWLANVIAIPWVSFTVVPFALAGVILLVLLPVLGGYLLTIAAFSLQCLLKLLTLLANIKPLLWQQAIAQPWVLAAAIVGCLLLLAPKGFPARGLGILWLLPIIFVKHPRPKPEEVWLAVLDVGQGLATVISTANHNAVYDTGPSYGPEFNMGSAVVMPYLHYYGIKQLDALIISHGDNDHSGGAQAILQGMKVRHVYSSVPQRLQQYAAKPCIAGYKWQWDGIQFEFIAPSFKEAYRGNNRSCVLRVSIGERHILLPGDIERQAEYNLLAQNSGKLAADVLVAPHHGSASSSTRRFVQAVHPHYVVFSSGYLNRFNFPAASVVKRYTNLGAETFNTTDCGMISFTITKQGVIEHGCYRQEVKLYN
jgi:competence protein ComEC